MKNNEKKKGTTSTVTKVIIAFIVLTMVLPVLGTAISLLF